VFFTDTRVPVSNIIWEEGNALKNTMKVFEKAVPTSACCRSA
jgi:hypothetical protein